MKVEHIRSKIASKIKYKEIVDFHWVQDCLKIGKQVCHEKYSMFVNVGEEEETLTVFENLRKRVKT